MCVGDVGKREDEIKILTDEIKGRKERKRREGRGGKQTDELHSSGEGLSYSCNLSRIILDIKEGRLNAEGGVVVIILCRHCGESKREGERGKRGRGSVKGWRSKERKGRVEDGPLTMALMPLEVRKSMFVASS